MNIVVDTNIFLAVALNQPEKHQIIELTNQTHLFSPEILPYEIGNALSAMLKRRQIQCSDIEMLLNITNNIPVRLLSTDIEASLQVAIRYNIYAYDAYFLYTALNRKIPLLTLDKKMRDIASQLNIKLLGDF